MAELAFLPGDRVKRRKNVFNDNSPMMHGTVDHVYGRRFHCTLHNGEVMDWVDDELYAVLWDNGKLDKAFFAHGLDKE
jgi:hypothetical protein